MSLELIVDIDPEGDGSFILISVIDAAGQPGIVSDIAERERAARLSFERDPVVIVVAAFFVIESRDLIPLVCDPLRVERGDLDLERYAAARRDIEVLDIVLCLSLELIVNMYPEGDVNIVVISVTDAAEHLGKLSDIAERDRSARLAFEHGPVVIVVAAFFVIEGRALVPLEADPLRVERGDFDLERYAAARRDIVFRDFILRLSLELIVYIDPEVDPAPVSIVVTVVTVCFGIVSDIAERKRAARLAFEPYPVVLVFAGFLVVDRLKLIPLESDPRHIERGDLELERQALARRNREGIYTVLCMDVKLIVDIDIKADRNHVLIGVADPAGYTCILSDIAEREGAARLTRNWYIFIPKVVAFRVVDRVVLVPLVGDPFHVERGDLELKRQVLARHDIVFRDAVLCLSLELIVEIDPERDVIFVLISVTDAAENLGKVSDIAERKRAARLTIQRDPFIPVFAAVLVVDRPVFVPLVRDSLHVERGDLDLERYAPARRGIEAVNIILRMSVQVVPDRDSENDARVCTEAVPRLALEAEKLTDGFQRIAVRRRALDRHPFGVVIVALFVMEGPLDRPLIGGVPQLVAFGLHLQRHRRSRRRKHAVDPVFRVNAEVIGDVDAEDHFRFAAVGVAHQAGYRDVFERIDIGISGLGLALDGHPRGIVKVALFVMEGLQDTPLIADGLLIVGRCADLHRVAAMDGDLDPGIRHRPSGQLIVDIDPELQPLLVSVRVAGRALEAARFGRIRQRIGRRGRAFDGQISLLIFVIQFPLIGGAFEVMTEQHDAHRHGLVRRYGEVSLIVQRFDAGLVVKIDGERAGSLVPVRVRGPAAEIAVYGYVFQRIACRGRARDGQILSRRVVIQFPLIGDALEIVAVRDDAHRHVLVRRHGEAVQIIRLFNVERIVDVDGERAGFHVPVRVRDPAAKIAEGGHILQRIARRGRASDGQIVLRRAVIQFPLIGDAFEVVAEWDDFHRHVRVRRHGEETLIVQCFDAELIIDINAERAEVLVIVRVQGPALKIAVGGHVLQRIACFGRAVNRPVDLVLCVIQFPPIGDAFEVVAEWDDFHRHVRVRRHGDVLIAQRIETELIVDMDLEVDLDGVPVSVLNRADYMDVMVGAHRDPVGDIGFDRSGFIIIGAGPHFPVICNAAHIQGRHLDLKDHIIMGSHGKIGYVVLRPGDELVVVIVKGCLPPHRFFRDGKRFCRFPLGARLRALGFDRIGGRAQAEEHGQGQDPTDEACFHVTAFLLSHAGRPAC